MSGMVIIGAGHAGARAAHALRKQGWEGDVILLDSENAIPYERPPLSKAMLREVIDFESFPIFQDAFLTDGRIMHLAGVTAVGIDRPGKSVICSCGRSIPYSALLLAPGAEPRRLAVPGAELGKVTVLRTAADSRALAAWLTPGARVVIIGGGLIGLEAAASAVKRGCAVTVVETAPRLMQRGIPQLIAEEVQKDHERAGVVFRVGRSVTALVGASDVSGVNLDDGEVLPCDAVLISIGIVPRIALAVAAGLATNDGIAVDQHLATSDPSIFAAGDACSFEDGQTGRRLRLECWKNAEDQAAVVAKNMLGAAEIYYASPWMWSDQYEKVIQVAGHPDLANSCVARRCDDGSLLLFHLSADDTVVGVSGYGSVREVGRGVRVGQMMAVKKVRPSLALLQDASVGLKELLLPAA